MDVERRTSEGFARGHFIIMHEHAWPESGGMRIDFQNENLVARIGKHVLGCVPDLICCLETEGASRTRCYVATAPTKNVTVSSVHELGARLCGLHGNLMRQHGDLHIPAVIMQELELPTAAPT